MKNVFYKLQKEVGQLILKIIEFTLNLFINKTESFDVNEYVMFKPFEDNWELIKEEYLNYVSKSSVDIMSEIFSEQERIAPGDNWESVVLKIYNRDIDTHQKNFPITTSLFKNETKITTVFFSILKPGKKITTHRGPYKGLLRYHLGLIVPDSKDCFISIENKKHFWNEGKSFIFDDTKEHFAQNLSSRLRVILFIDFYRDLPFPINYLNKIIVSLISKSLFITNVVNKIQSK